MGAPARRARPTRRGPVKAGYLQPTWGASFTTMSSTFFVIATSDNFSERAGTLTTVQYRVNATGGQVRFMTGRLYSNSGTTTLDRFAVSAVSGSFSPAGGLSTLTASVSLAIDAGETIAMWCSSPVNTRGQYYGNTGTTVSVGGTSALPTVGTIYTLGTQVANSAGALGAS